MSRKTTITGEGIRDETVDSADLASGSIKAGELSAQSISGQATITSADTTNDRLLILDATDSALKQVSIGNLGVTANAAGSDGQIQYNNGGSAMGGASVLYWDDTNGRLGVGAPSPSHLFTVESTSAFMASARNTGTNSAGAVITVENSRGGGNGVAEDFCGAVRFDANDSAGNSTQYAKISGIVHSPTDNSEIGRIVFETTTPLANKGTPLYLRGNAVHILSGGASASADEANGADVAFYVSGTMGSAGTAVRGASLFGGDLVVSGNVRATSLDVSGDVRVDEYIYHNDDADTFIQFTDDQILLKAGDKSFIRLAENGASSNIIFNNGANNIDVQFKGDSDVNLLYLDAGNDKVGIGIAVPTEKLDVVGNIKASGDIYSDKIRRETDASDTTKILLNEDLIKLYAGSTSTAIVRIGDTNKGADSNFWVSGSVGSQGGPTRGTAIFGGDLVVSGGLAVDGIINSWNKNAFALADNTGGGEIVTFGSEDGTDALAAGKLMYLNSSGVWKYTDANASATSGGVLLAIALGTAVADGLLIRGFFDAATIQGSFLKGGVCYISEVAGTIDFTAPSGVGDTIRVIGYGIDIANVIYFNPSSTWIEL